jgi:hypothetical protein
MSSSPEMPFRKAVSALQAAALARCGVHGSGGLLITRSLRCEVILFPYCIGVYRRVEHPS